MIHLPARVVRIQRQDGAVLLHGSMSDTKPDMYQTRMDVRLYRNFLRRIEDGSAPIPYLSISHYHSIPFGQPTKLYIDGRYLKFVSTLERTPLTEGLIKNLDDPDFRAKLGFSIGFNDLDSYEDEQAGGMTVFVDGVLEHYALTTIPANPRARLQTVELRAHTQLADATALLGPKSAAYLDSMERQAMAAHHTERPA